MRDHKIWNSNTGRVFLQKSTCPYCHKPKDECTCDSLSFRDQSAIEAEKLGLPMTKPKNMGKGGQAIYNMLNGLINKEYNGIVKSDYDTPTNVRSKQYSWGTMRNVERGNSYGIPIHPEHWDKITSTYNTSKPSKFVDETRRSWSVTKHPSGDGVVLTSPGHSRGMHLNSESLNKLNANSFLGKEGDNIENERDYTLKPFKQSKKLGTFTDTDMTPFISHHNTNLRSHDIAYQGPESKFDNSGDFHYKLNFKDLPEPWVISYKKKSENSSIENERDYGDKWNRMREFGSTKVKPDSTEETQERLNEIAMRRQQEENYNKDRREGYGKFR